MPNLPPSLYAQTANPAPPTPALEGDMTATVCVVGGGFTGLSTALHLAEYDVDVVVLEAEEPGWGASGRNGGQVNPGLKYNPDEVETHHSLSLGGRMLDLSYGAPDYVFDLIRRYQINCEARQEGTIRAAIGKKNAEEVRISAQQCAKRGWPVRFLDARETAAITGTDRYAGSMVDDRGGDLQPLSYARGLAAAAMQRGARVFGSSPATSLRQEGTRWRVTTPKGSVLAEQVVLATNGYTDGLWPQLRESVVPVYSSIAATAPLPDDVVRGILPRRGSLYEAGIVTVYYRVDQANRLLMGGRGPQKPIADTSPIRYLMDYAERLWPQLKGAAWTHGWNGQIAATQDHYPHIHEPAPGIIAALGYNGRGVAMATVMGKEIARRLTGTAANRLDMPVSPIKPIAFHRFWRIGVTWKMLEGRVRDRLGF